MSFVNRAVLIYLPNAGEPLLAQVKTFAATEQIAMRLVTLAEFIATPEAELQDYQHVVALVDDGHFAALVDLAKRLDFSLGVVPVGDSRRLNDWFQFPADLVESVRLAFIDTPHEIDILRCNGEVALGTVMLGRTPFLSHRNRARIHRHRSWLSRLRYQMASLVTGLRSLFAIQPFLVKITTRKEKPLETAITGIVVIENDLSSAAARLVSPEITAQDGKFSTLVIAPQSITEYLAFLLRALMAPRQRRSRLPDAIGYIKSGHLKIESHQPMPFFVDGQRRESQVVEMELHPKAVRVNLTDEYRDLHKAVPEGRDSLRVDTLPTHSERLAMIQQHLPLFTHALEEEFRELFLLLRENSKAPPHYLVLMVLSSIVASLGLFLSSAAVIIGAMVLAPLMSPIISLSMGLLRGEHQMLRESLKTIGIGVALALMVSGVIAMLIPIERITPEIAGRLTPNLLDLGVAIASGIAGAYAYARASVMHSLPGVAIAVALVPPLCVAGIGIGWLDLQVISGAMLLFLTNLVGISLSASMTFLVLGYAPIQRAKRGLAISALMIALISIPLSISFYDIHRHWSIEHDAATLSVEHAGRIMRLADIKVTVQRGRILLRADVLSKETLDRADFLELKRALSERWGSEVEIEARPRLLL